MFVNKISLFLILALAVCNISAQDNDIALAPDDIFYSIQDDTYGGTISLYQDPLLHVLVDKYARINEKQGLKGYRIQIYSGSGVSARAEANSARYRLLNLFPEFDPSLIYFDYHAPYFKVVIGDYRNKNEAFEVYHDIKRKFSGSYIVKTRIRFPKLSSK